MTTLDYNAEDAIRELLLGRRVVSVEQFAEPMKVDDMWSPAEGKLTLDDGREVFVVPNVGGCSCGAGDYALTGLERVDNVITRVDFAVDDESTDEYEAEQTYRIFVLAGHEQINLLSVHGDDGNGYYGTGYELVVRGPGTTGV